MASLDFVYDLVEKMQKQKMDYLVVTLRRGEENEMADLFYHFTDDESIATFADLLKEFRGDGIGFEEVKETSKPDPPKKKPKKRAPKRNKRRKKDDE